MESGVTQFIGHGGKLVVHIAENGHSFEIDCDESMLVETVQRFIESVSGIHSKDQLLLCFDMRLESQKLLSDYKLPSYDQEVFLFNKMKLQANSSPPSTEEVDIVEIDDPQLSLSSLNSHPLDDATDPALKALPSYERQFVYHYHCGHAIYDRTQSKFQICQRLVGKAKVQERAVEVARANLEQYYRIVNLNYLDFIRRYAQQFRYHSELLVNFGRDVERLRSCKLHPALQTPSRRCLLDFVKEENLGKWVDACNSSHKQIDCKISEFKEWFTDVKQKAEGLLSSKASLPIKNMEMLIKEHMADIDEQKSIMQSLSKDVGTVKKLVDECLALQVSSHDAVSALGPMYEGHDKIHLPKMQDFYNSTSKLLDFCKDKKNEMNTFVHNYMQNITYMSHVIKEAKMQFPVFKEAIRRQDEIFMNLRLVCGIGPAYRACLAEIVRRKASMKLYMGMAGDLAEKLATKRDLEVRRREEFLKTQSQYIHRDMLSSMGLFDTPNLCDVNIAPFDGSLLDVDISDLEHYAPNYLDGLPYKNESFSQAEEKYDSDCCSDLVVAGTCKLEVENAKLKAELAAAIARICSFGGDVEYESLDDDKLDALLKNTAKKTSEALHLKDEYENHLKSLLNEKQTQCVSYMKRIQELEQRLSDQYLPGGHKDCGEKVDDSKSEISGDVCTSEPMDEVSYASNSLDGKLGIFAGQFRKAGEGVDENMLDLCEEVKSNDNKSKSNEFISEPVSDKKASAHCKISDDDVLELQTALAEKLNLISETESKLKDAVEQVAVVGRELELSRNLLDESQMNCAHLENCLHEAREEAQTHLCAADRRASEYSALRASAVKMRGLFERLRSCVTSSGASVLADPLRALASSLSKASNDGDDDCIIEFRTCIQVLAEKVGLMSRHRTELLERCSKLELSNKQLVKELEEKKELGKSLYAKHQLVKQASKEKICYNQLQVHEIAAFVLNSAGHYEAISRTSPNYYLSAESVALFADFRLPHLPSYVIGQIVHIEKKTVNPNPNPNHGDGAGTSHNRLPLNQLLTSNPYNLPIGTDFFLVTVAMLPDTTQVLP